MRVLLFTLCLLYAGQSVSAAMLGHAVLESRLVFLSTADFSDEAYWATHHICVVRVRSLDIDPERVIVELETDHCFTAGAPSHVVARGDGFCFRSLDSGALVETGDRLLVSFPKDRDVGWLDAEVLPDAPTGSALHKRLDRISALRVRANADRDMIDGAMDDDAAVSAYCLRRMVKRPPGLTADDQRRLQPSPRIGDLRGRAERTSRSSYALASHRRSDVAERVPATFGRTGRAPLERLTGAHPRRFDGLNTGFRHRDLRLSANSSCLPGGLPA